MDLLDRLGDALEGKGRTILYGSGGVLLAVIVVIAFVKWNARKGDEARQALGRAIDISTAALPTAENPNPSGLTFPTDLERSKRAIEEFEKVAAKYGDPYRTEARYF